MPILKPYPFKTAPFIRLIIPFIFGILWAFYFNASLSIIQILATVSMLVLLIFSLLTLVAKYHWQWISGIAINGLIIAMGAGLTNFQNLPTHRNFIGNYLQQNNPIFIRIKEPLVQKPKTFKTVASAVAVFENGHWVNTSGNILVYFKKASLANTIHCGDGLIIQQPLKPIGNINGFNYQQYCAFQQIYFQVFIPDSVTQIFAPTLLGSLQAKLFLCRDWVLKILETNIPGSIEKAVAEALLIGYKDKLDKSLVQAYSRTGVVHIIAISGLHLGMIYGLLLLLLKPFGKRKWANHLRSIIIAGILWGFSIITGGAAAILRSAVTFSFILASKSLGYKNNTINALAASAFCLLAYNPYFLWDIGFELSYTAVLGIILFQKSISNWFVIKNKLLLHIWQLNAVTLSAQIFTIPLILFYFRQFPNLLLFTNFFIVPLSGLVLYAELILLAVSPFTSMASVMGKVVGFLINQMNALIERTNRLPFAVTENLQVSIAQTVLMYIAIVAWLYWLVHKDRKGFWIGLCALLACIFLRWMPLF